MTDNLQLNQEFDVVVIERVGDTESIICYKKFKDYLYTISEVTAVDSPDYLLAFHRQGKDQ